MDNIITKASDFSVESLDGEKGIVEAYVSTFGNADKVGDVMASTAFDKFVEDFEKVRDNKLPMLLQHSQSNIVGEWNKFVIDSKGIKGFGEIYTETAQGSDALAFIKRGLISSTSIGFRSKNYERIEKGGNLFKEVTLVETSLVINPANPKAVITSVKDEEGKIDIRKLEKLLRDVDLSQKERKLLLAGGVKALMEQRDVVTEVDRKQELAEGLLARFS